VPDQGEKSFKFLRSVKKNFLNFRMKLPPPPRYY